MTDELKPIPPEELDKMEQGYIFIRNRYGGKIDGEKGLRLVAEIRRLQKVAENNFQSWMDLGREHKKFKIELEFYGDKQNYIVNDPGDECSVSGDSGKRARKILGVE